MNEWQQKAKGGARSAPPMSREHTALVEMGFSETAVAAALVSAGGVFDVAMAVLLGEPLRTPVGPRPPPSVVSAASKPPASAVSSRPANTGPRIMSLAPDMRDPHNKFMSTFKTTKCKDKTHNHDKRMCLHYHTKSDRRRNPFEIAYMCSECPNGNGVNESAVCDDGDNCLKAHNMLERMFHPELYKISMCQRGPSGNHCERGPLCAFAHSDDDHRLPLSQMQNKIAAANAAAIAAAAASAAAVAAADAASSASSLSNGSASPKDAGASKDAGDALQVSKAMSDSRLLDSVQDKLIRLIKAQGTEGIISSELPKRFMDAYAERLELQDEMGEKFRIKDLLLAHPGISVTMHKNVQPKYVYEAPKQEGGGAASPDASASGVVGGGGASPSLLPTLSSEAATVSPTEKPSPRRGNGPPAAPPSAASTIGSSSGSNNEQSLTDSLGADGGVRMRRRGPSAPLPNLSLEEQILGASSVSPSLSGSTTTLGGLLPNGDPVYRGGNEFSSSTAGGPPPGVPSPSFLPGFGGMDFPFGGLGAGIGGARRRGPDGGLLEDAQQGLFSLGGLPSNGGLGSGAIAFDSTSPYGVAPLSPLSLQQQQHQLLSQQPMHQQHQQSLPLSSAHGSNNGSSILDDSLSQANAALKSSVESLRGEIQQKQRELDQQTSQLSNTLKLLDETISLQNAATTESKNLRAELSSIQKTLGEQEGELKTAKETLREREVALQKAEKDKNALVPELNKLRTKLGITESDLESIRSKASKLEKEEKKAKTENEELKKELGAFREGRGPDMLREQLSKAQRDLAERDRAIEKLTLDLTAKARLEQSVATLERSLSESEEARRKILSKADAYEAANGVSLGFSEAEVETELFCALPGCNEKGPFFCSGCSTVAYCGEVHQKTHWKIHKKTCAGAK